MKIGDVSSERERRKSKEWKKGSKVEEIEEDREELLKVKPQELPEDAKFKGYEEGIVQDIKIQTDNVRFRKEKYYSAREGKSYVAEVPKGYEGQYGAGIKAKRLVMYYGMNTREPKIVEFFWSVGIKISVGEVSNLLIRDQEEFHEEKEELYVAGLKSSRWQQIDDTGTRVDGVKEHCQVVCNPLYMIYVRREKKDRLRVLEALSNGKEPRCRLNEEAYKWLEEVGMSSGVVAELKKLPGDKTWSVEEFQELLKEKLPKLGKQQEGYIVEEAAVAAYHAQQEFPIVHVLMGDDAGQFKRLTEELALWWVHDGRHYKKLTPAVGLHRKKVEEFLQKYWKYYDRLLKYRKHPGNEEAAELSREFDELLSTVSGYDE